MFTDMLGYDPHPDLTLWQGTPIPCVKDPLPRTEERWRIANYVWWNGPPWTVLRNAHVYLWHVMDFGQSNDVFFTLKDVPKSIWLAALDAARPGVLSKGSYILWSVYFKRGDIDAHMQTWPDDAHRLDFRPQRNEPRERMYERHRHAHEAKLRAPISENFMFIQPCPFDSVSSTKPPAASAER